MQVVHAALQKVIAKFSGQRRGQQVGCAVAGRILEGVVNHWRDMGAAHGGELACPTPVFDRQDAWQDGRGDPGGDAGVAEAEEGFRLKEELGDGGMGTRVDLALEVVDICLGVGGIGVLLGVGPDPDAELARLCQRLDQLDRT